MSSRDCCKDGTSRPDFDPKRNFMGQPWLDHEDSTPPLSYLDQASAAPLFGHAPGLDWRWFREMKREAVIQFRRQLPEIQQALLQSCQGSYVRCRLVCRLYHDQADPLERFEQQLGTWSLGLSARLAGVQPFQGLLGFLQ